MYSKQILLGLLCIISCNLSAQTQDAESIKQIFNETLVNGKAYSWLEYLTTNIGHRLSGSVGAASAVDWSKTELANIGDSVWLQPVTVPRWIRGESEEAYIKGRGKKDMIKLNVCALGGSVGTGPDGIGGNIVEVQNFEELKALGANRIKGKIVFFNRPMDPTAIHTFSAYGGAVEQRVSGASEAARLGAIGVVVRSMGLDQEDYPHTGSLVYAAGAPQIPAIAIATKHATLLSQRLKANVDLQFFFETHCEIMPDVQSYNVIAELKGSEYREELIVVGGHLDSWDLGQGAHDDGSGCVQSMEVLRIFKMLGIVPKHTIRVVLFMNEENGLRGGIEYARIAGATGEKHIVAIESDNGGFTPRGFNMNASTEFRNKVLGWRPLLEPYGLTDFTREGGGADISPLAGTGIPLIGYMPDSQRYFNYHHTAEDTFDKISKRELELGAGSMAALVFLIDKYGTK